MRSSWTNQMEVRAGLCSKHTSSVHSERGATVLHSRTSRRLEIPLKPVVNHFHTIAVTEPNQLWIPNASNFPCVDFLLSPKDLFQVTVSTIHPIKGHPLSELVNNIRQHHWISQDEQPRLIFVVPEHAFHDFPL
ncbi:hypothetical protein K457DRAFT_23727 [Linnemannia elongata AG-77]|uniref:Uncharacterized protein n=1 Tax=Linnemannia elongata AG-77 TaxID=1314771 RepID=A0A197JHZ0_9FUNG|nr:hypothetical protein K457DRAFT_23727 [Linnemannia elongata AG-77]